MRRAVSSLLPRYGRLHPGDSRPVPGRSRRGRSDVPGSGRRPAERRTDRSRPVVVPSAGAQRRGPLPRRGHPRPRRPAAAARRALPGGRQAAPAGDDLPRLGRRGRSPPRDRASGRRPGRCCPRAAAPVRVGARRRDGRVRLAPRPPDGACPCPRAASFRGRHRRRSTVRAEHRDLLGDLADAEADELAAELPAPMRRIWRELVVELVCGQRYDLTGSAAGRHDLPHARHVARSKSARTPSSGRSSSARRRPGRRMR